MVQPRPMGELEAVVMEEIWQRDTAVTVREVLETLAHKRPLAYTTVMTVMDNLYRKGYLEREESGRAYRYQAADSRQAHSARLMRAALTTSDDPVGTLACFVQQMRPEDASTLAALLAQLPEPDASSNAVKSPRPS